MSAHLKTSSSSLLSSPKWHGFWGRGTASGDSPPRGDVTDEEMRYQRPHKPHAKRLEARGRAGGSGRETDPTCSAPLGLPKVPVRRELTESTPRQRWGKRAGSHALSRGGCHWSPGVLNPWGSLRLGPSHLKTEIQSQLDKSVKPGLLKSQTGGGHAGGNMLELNRCPCGHSSGQ